MVVAVVTLTLVGVAVTIAVDAAHNSSHDAVAVDTHSSTLTASSASADVPTPTTGGVSPSNSASSEADGVRVDVPNQPADCVSTATDDVQTFLIDHGCSGLTRGLYHAGSASRPVLVAAAEVHLSDAASVPGFISLVLADGTGHIATLVDDHLGSSSDPTVFAQDATYLVRAGTTPGEVDVLEAMWLDAPTAANDPSLTAVLTTVFDGLN